MPAKEEFVEVNGCKVRLARAGKGPKVLFLHGANGPAIWVPFFDKLAERFEVIAPDHPTYGKSGDPEWLEDIGDLAFFYLDFLKALDLKKVNILGHSMGGWLAMEIAIRDTSRLASVTVVSPAGIRVKGHPPADIFKLTPPEMMPLVYADKALVQKMLDMLAQPKSDAELDELIRTRTASARLCWHPRLYNPKLARWLHRIDVPTQVVWGDRDGVIPPAHASELGRLIPGAKVVMIDRCGHSPQVEKPEKLLDAISTFLTERVS
jgi:pimeloyl-ACP methyl ester carboxylesterase